MVSGDCGPVELLYRGNQWLPVVEGWPGRAPWLWPVAGRCYTADDIPRIGMPDFDRDRCSWMLNGEKRTMWPHGFARHRPWRLVQSNDTHCLLDLQSDGAERQAFPFDYALYSELEAAADGVRLTMQVTAGAVNARPMPFHAGLHTTFDFAAWWGTSWLEGRVIGLGEKAFDVNTAMQAGQRFALPGDGVTLGDERLQAAIIPAMHQPSVQLVSPDGTRALRLSFGVEPPASAGAPKGRGRFTQPPQPDQGVWVTYMDPARRFFCVEPWIGWPNAMNSGRGRVDLAPGESWRWWIRFQVEEGR